MLQMVPVDMHAFLAPQQNFHVHPLKLLFGISKLEIWNFKPWSSVQGKGIYGA
jgi:hypothetical protein